MIKNNLALLFIAILPFSAIAGVEPNPSLNSGSNSTQTESSDERTIVQLGFLGLYGLFLKAKNHFLNTPKANKNGFNRGKKKKSNQKGKRNQKTAIKKKPEKSTGYFITLDTPSSSTILALPNSPHLNNVALEFLQSTDDSVESFNAPLLLQEGVNPSTDLFLNPQAEDFAPTFLNFLEAQAEDLDEVTRADAVGRHRLPFFEELARREEGNLLTVDDYIIKRLEDSINQALENPNLQTHHTKRLKRLERAIRLLIHQARELRRVKCDADEISCSLLADSQEGSHVSAHERFIWGYRTMELSDEVLRDFFPSDLDGGYFGDEVSLYLPKFIRISNSLYGKFILRLSVKGLIDLSEMIRRESFDFLSLKKLLARAIRNASGLGGGFCSDYLQLKDGRWIKYGLLLDPDKQKAPVLMFLELEE